MVKEKKIVLCFSYCKSMRHDDPRGVANWTPWDMIGRIYVGYHQTLLHTKNTCFAELFGNRWCKRESVECNAMKEWKLSIFNIVDKRIKFYSQNTNLLPPKPKSSFRHLKQGIQEFHRKYVLVPADKAANNVVVVCRLHYINTLKQELNGTKAYEETSIDEKSVVYSHSNEIPNRFAVDIKERQVRNSYDVLVTQAS